MELEPKGNLGKVDLLHRYLREKELSSENGTVTLTVEEVKEVTSQLFRFQILLANVFMQEEALKHDQYGGIIQVMKELEPYYRHYKGEKNK